MVCLTVWLGVIASAAVAQTNTAEIGGVVRDVSGGVLPGADVVARHVVSGTTLARVTDGQGRFFLPALRIGQWDVVVSLSGFAPQHHTIVVEMGQSVALDFTLKVAGVAEQVRVEVVAPMLQATSAEISDVIENRQVVQLPLNGRQFLALAQLSDSVVIPPGGTRGDALQQAGPLPNVGGQRSGHNVYLLDGATCRSSSRSRSTFRPASACRRCRRATS
ncbi:MAG: carboxypeptidase-like regulatory domain-containing protein [Cyanobacteria bacterium]|nr:carboxypeptidase-like regulatory domain-containing protein [Cyanobacteriota bacterium]